MIRNACIRARLSGLGLLLLAALAHPVSVDANPTIASAWTTRYSASSASYNNAGCALCHDKTIPDSLNLRWNGYGRALRLALTQPTIDAALASIENGDADGDAAGASNLAEIQASTQPGWRAGSTNTLYDTQNAAVATNVAPATGIIGDVDPAPIAPPPSLSINDVALPEGNSGLTPFVFAVSLSSASTSTVTVDYATASGSAMAGVDFVPASGTLTIPAGATSGTVTVQVVGNTTVDGNRTFSVQLSGPENATIANGSGIATIIDDDAAPAHANFQGLWWNSPPGSESGWGINFAHQADVIFGSWFTYDLNGRGWWLVMVAYQTGANTFAGDLFEARGPPFDTVPFVPLGSPGGATTSRVGNVVLTFTDVNNGTFAYTVNGISQTKSITRQVLGAAPLPICVFDPLNNLAAATNYQDIWWAAPAASEDGWGINLTHQGSTIFASWFTYDSDRAPMWLVVTALQTGPATFTGDLYRTTGPPFNAAPFPPIGSPGGAVPTNVGTATFAFADGQTGSFAYTVNGVAQTKAITRQVFRPPGTVCN